MEVVPTMVATLMVPREAVQVVKEIETIVVPTEAVQVPTLVTLVVLHILLIIHQEDMWKTILAMEAHIMANRVAMALEGMKADTVVVHMVIIEAPSIAHQAQEGTKGIKEEMKVVHMIIMEALVMSSHEEYEDNRR